MATAMTRFRNRTEAGRILAERVREYAGRQDVVVLGLPRGGVPVAFEVAQALGVLLAVLVDAGDGWSAAGGAVRALAVVEPQKR
jgi:adenine/guanine phosphoribosyltransferase-like PRPP-binding protein